MAKNPDIEKFCKNCGVKIERKYINGRIEDYRKYVAREHCSFDCCKALRKKKASLAPPPTKAEITTKIAEDLANAAIKENRTPLEYLLHQMNNPLNLPAFRKECAIQAAPYCHPKLDGKSNKTKKEERAEAAGKVAAGGKFSQTAAPKVVGRIG